MLFKRIPSIVLCLIAIASCSKDENLNIDNKDIDKELAAFPGVEGFGRATTGGRNGDVVYVTNLESQGVGSLNDALGFHGNAEMQKKRYILFKVSGIIDRTGIYDDGTHIEYGDFTLAGHTSKGGIILGGIMAWDKMELGNLNNFIIQHIRSRPSGVESGMDDAIRLNESSNYILDHCSFAWAGDECMQIAANKNITIQNCIFAETLGEHSDRGGVLIKYSSKEHQNTNISFHHNSFIRIGGRLPQISPSTDEAGRGMNIEVSNNLIWDPGSTMGIITASHITNFVTEVQEYVDWYCHLNYINNYSYTLDVSDKEDYWINVVSIDLQHNNSQIYVAGNKMNLYDTSNKVKINDKNCIIRDERHDFPEITYHDGEELFDYMVENTGAFPRDAMDQRFMEDIKNREIDATPCNEKGADDGLTFDWDVMPIPELDSDDDGMPDWWELHNGLNPLEKDHNGKDLSVLYTGVEGYDNLEVYLNQLSLHLVKNSSLTIGQSKTYDSLIESFEITNENNVTPGSQLTFEIALKSTNIEKLELSLALLEAPFQWPTPGCLDITSKLASNISFSFDIPAERTVGDYSVMLHALSKDGIHDYKILDFEMN